VEEVEVEVEVEVEGEEAEGNHGSDEQSPLFIGFAICGNICLCLWKFDLFDSIHNKLK